MTQLTLTLAFASGLIAGVDEAGRGPLAGPVYAAAVILHPRRRINGLTDSKLIKPDRREVLAQRIQERALSWGVGRAEAGEIDTLNIHHATLLAMQRAVAALAVQPELVQVDGKFCPRLGCAVEAIVKGDLKVRAISAASILAKVGRDREMTELDARYPGYGFAVHKGYSTPAHCAALKALGPCPEHRRSFEPVRSWRPSEKAV